MGLLTLGQGCQTHLALWTRCTIWNGPTDRPSLPCIPDPAPAASGLGISQCKLHIAPSPACSTGSRLTGEGAAE